MGAARFQQLLHVPCEHDHCSARVVCFY